MSKNLYYNKAGDQQSYSPDKRMLISGSVTEYGQNASQVVGALDHNRTFEGQEVIQHNYKSVSEGPKKRIVRQLINSSVHQKNSSMTPCQPQNLTETTNQDSFDKRQSSMRNDGQAIQLSQQQNIQQHYFNHDLQSQIKQALSRP